VEGGLCDSPHQKPKVVVLFPNKIAASYQIADDVLLISADDNEGLKLLLTEALKWDH
jgi:hypothetical protein